MANPFPLVFEELMPAFSVAGSKCTVAEAPAWTPTTSIQLGQQWSVTFDWETLGWLNNLDFGDWKLTVYLEQMGGGEFSLPGNTVTIGDKPGPDTYSATLTFPANTVADEGAYRIVTTVEVQTPLGFQLPISAIGEGPIIHFYEFGF